MRILVFDIGGTAIKYGVCRDGVLEQVRETPTHAHLGGAHILELICSLIEQESDYDAIGVSTAGQVNTDLGSIHYANSNIPGYTGTDIRGTLESRFHVPVMVENDVNCAAMGEAVYGAGMGERDFLCLTYGTGVGGAIVLNGEIYHGKGFCAGEFGGIITDGRALLGKDRPEDVYAGAYEKLASTTALVRSLQSKDSSLHNGKAIFARLEEPMVKEGVNAWIDQILVGLSTLIHIFNPSCVILGGGIMVQPYIHRRIQ